MSEAGIYGDRHLALLQEVRGMQGAKLAALAGSRIIAGGFTDGSDYDIVVYADDDFDPGAEWIANEDADYDSVGYNMEAVFSTYRRGKDNLIVYYEYVPFAVFRNLANYAARIRLVKKEERVALFCSVLHGTRG